MVHFYSIDFSQNGGRKRGFESRHVQKKEMIGYCAFLHHSRRFTNFNILHIKWMSDGSIAREKGEGEEREKKSDRERDRIIVVNG
jgi:hypothetical protein